MLQGVLVCAGHAADAASGASEPGLISEGAEKPVDLGGIDLYLDVTLNGTHKGLVHFGDRNGKLWVSRTSLLELGFSLPADAGDPLSLDALNGVHVDYDAKRQTVVVVAPLALLRLDTTELGAVTNRRSQASTSPGALLNYNVYGNYGAHGANTLSAFAELRAFNSWGVFSTTELAQHTDSGNGTLQNHTVRLDTTWTTSFPDELISLRIGDMLTDALSWTRSTRIGGIQIGTNFGLQPYLVTAPLPQFIGSATLPSDVQLYVNGLRQYSGQVPAGPFQLSTIPNISGAGNAQVVLTNALGETTTLNFSLYGEHRLLQEGLNDWSAEVGFVRKNYGLDSFDYSHDAAGSATWRYGLTNNFTIEAHGETTRNLENGVVGADWLLGTSGGVLSASAGYSESGNRTGEQFGLGYTWSNSRLSFGASATHTSGTYRDVATFYGAPPPTLSAQAFASYNFDRLGAFGVSYVDLHSPLQDNSRFASAYWFKSFGQRLSLNFSLSQDLDNSRNRTAFLLATFSFDHNITASAGLQRVNDRTGFTANAMQALPSQGGLGWRAAVSAIEGQSGGEGEIEYLGRYGQLTAGIYDIGPTRYAYGGATGSLVLMGGGLFAARQINDGFAVVSTDGVAGVPIGLQNNPVGVTDNRGLLLVTPVNSYQDNKITIDPMKLPPDVRIARVDANATPTDRSGVVVSFGIQPVRAASVILVDAAGKPLPVGSLVRVRGQAGEPVLVGFDGAVYLDTLDAHDDLDVETASGRCHASFDYPTQKGSIPQIGPLVCQKASP